MFKMLVTAAPRAPGVAASKMPFTYATAFVTSAATKPELPATIPTLATIVAATEAVVEEPNEFE